MSILLRANRRPSAAIAALIATFEGGQSSDGKFRPYRDAVGVWTIGYGHTEGVGPHSATMTKAQALALLRKDLDAVYGAAVRKTLRAIGPLRLSQKQFDALVSIVYNVGPGILAADRSLGSALRWYAKTRARAQRSGVARAIKLYDKAGGRALPGLTRRRKAEASLWMGGSYAA